MFHGGDGIVARRQGVGTRKRRLPHHGRHDRNRRLVLYGHRRIHHSPRNGPAAHLGRQRGIRHHNRRMPLHAPQEQLLVQGQEGARTAGEGRGTRRRRHHRRGGVPHDEARNADLRPHPCRRIQGEPQGPQGAYTRVGRHIRAEPQAQIFAHAHAAPPQRLGTRTLALLRAGCRLPERDSQGAGTHHTPRIRTHRQQPRGPLARTDIRPDAHKRRGGRDIRQHQPHAHHQRLLGDRHRAHHA